MRREGIYGKNYIRPQLSKAERQGSKWREIPLSLFKNYDDLEYEMEK